MSGPNLNVPDSSQEGVLDSQLDLDQTVVIRNTTSDEKLEDLDFEEGGLRGWLAVLGAQVSTHLKYNYLSSMNLYSALVQFCGFGYGITFKQTSSLFFLLCGLIGT